MLCRCQKSECFILFSMYRESVEEIVSKLIFQVFLFFRAHTQSLNIYFSSFGVVRKTCTHAVKKLNAVVDFRKTGDKEILFFFKSLASEFNLNNRIRPSFFFWQALTVIKTSSTQNYNISF